MGWRGQRRTHRVKVVASVVSAAAMVASLLVTAAAPAGAAGTPIIFGVSASQGVKTNGVPAYQSLWGRQVGDTRVFYLWDAYHSGTGINTFPDLTATWAKQNHVPLLMSVKSKMTNGTKVSWSSIANASPTTNRSVYDAIVGWASAIKSYGAHVYFSFNHEPEASASNGMGTAKDYIGAWHNIVSIFRAQGVTNAEYVFIATAFGFTRNSDVAQNYYPGDDIIDDIAADAYNWADCRPEVNTRWNSLQSLINPTNVPGSWPGKSGRPANEYGLVRFGAQHPTKGLMLAEFGSVENLSGTGQSKAAWLADAQTLLKQPAYSQIKLINLWNSFGNGNHSTCDFRINSSQSALDAMRAWGADPAFNPDSTTPPPPPPTASTPGKVTGVTATLQNNKVSALVSWTQVTSDPAVTKYVVREYDSTNKLLRTVNIRPTKDSTRIGSLPPGTLSFTVAAKNSKGYGPESDPAVVVVPGSSDSPTPPASSAPVQVTGVTATLQSNQTSARVSWSPVTADPAVGKYIIREYDSSNTLIRTVNIKPTKSSTVVGGLTPGTTVSFTVAAKNSDGIGPESTPAIVVVPGTPTSTGVVSEKPATWTPQVLNGAVNAITQVGNTIVIGGTFTKASQVRNGAEISRPYIMAFDANTGVISTTFAPKLDSQVMSLAPGPDGKSVFVGGTFTSVNGQAVKKLVKLDITNGQRIGAFTATTDGPVRTLKVSGDELYVGGSFSHLAGAKRKMLGAVNVGTGAIDKSLSFTISGTHNGGSTGITAIDINPAGSKLVAIGNFTSVNGNSRDQIFLVDLGSQATLSNWSTTRLQTQCAKGWKSYAQAVDFAPDGSWFALASSGGAFKNSVCDSVSRWSITSESPGQHEVWADYTGGDSLLSVAVTPNAVYVGGHQRWMNNPDGHNDAGPGAVARSGIAAVDPGNGLPLPWNPGRTRGRGAAALLATSSGLWVGSDTTWLGGFYHARIGFFPAS